MNCTNKNIILIGMMGSGKTTIGKMIAKELSMHFEDTDEYIEKHMGASISEIFKNGEKYFRNIEAKAIRELSLLNSSVISTGGGAVKNEENIINLRKNGIIFFLDRPIANIVSDIEIDKRPLLKDNKNKIFEIFNNRYELYKKSSDLIIKNDKKIEQSVQSIIKNYYLLSKK